MKLYIMKKWVIPLINREIAFQNIIPLLKAENVSLLDYGPGVAVAERRK